MNQSPSLKHSPVLAPEVRLQRYLIGSGAVLLALFLFSFTGGPYPIPVESVVAVFLHRLHLVDKTWSNAVELVVFNIRGPRIAAAILVGATLGMAGATYQDLFRNPLVSPAILGVSAGAGFGAALGVMFNLSRLGIQGTPFVCGLAAVAMAVGLEQRLDRHALLVMVLAGMVVSAFFQALIALLKVFADRTHSE